MKYLFLITLAFLVNLDMTAQVYPEIKTTLSISDPLFKQQQKETESWYFNQARARPAPPLSIYQYRTKPSDSLFQLAAIFNLTIDTLATINGFQSVYEFESGSLLIVPSNPGVYLEQNNSSRWIRTLKESLDDQEFQNIVLTVNGVKKEFRYYPGSYLPHSQRIRFVQPLFLPPLESLYVTSPYGYRDHPFTGQWELHKGIDYRANVGTAVRSCSNGKIFAYGELEDYGKYIIIQHRNGYTSLYGHLSRIEVAKGQIVDEGDIIGRSGNTGLSTGPHLHFEIRKNGLPQNPENLLNIGGL